MNYLWKPPSGNIYEVILSGRGATIIRVVSLVTSPGFAARVGEAFPVDRERLVPLYDPNSILKGML